MFYSWITQKEQWIILQQIQLRYAMSSLNQYCDNNLCRVIKGKEEKIVLVLQ